MKATDPGRRKYEMKRICPGGWMKVVPNTTPPNP
jgi:hypothetical protein